MVDAGPNVLMQVLGCSDAGPDGVMQVSGWFMQVRMI